MNLTRIITDLNTQEKCIQYLESERWNNVPTCPYCMSQSSSPKNNRHTCLACKNSYSVTVGTVFHNSNIPLTKWFMAICLILSAKKGISSLQLSRDISVNKNTAWLLQMKIRVAMKENDLLSGIIEIDETFVGGKRKNRHYSKRKKDDVIPGSSTKKPILGMVQRSGKIVAKVIDKAWGKEMMPILKNVITPESTLITDGFGGYYYASEHFKSHQIINHTENYYRKGDFHTNTIEGFWGILKRAIIGQYHRINNSFLQLYVDEISFKYNHRNLDDYGYETSIQELNATNLN